MPDADPARIALLRQMDQGLHDLSQPMTVLLCTLEYGSALNSVEEMRQAMTEALNACGSLRMTVHEMQQQVREALDQQREQLDEQTRGNS